MLNEKTIKKFRIVTLALWLIYSVAVLLDADLVYNLFSPMTAFSAVILIWLSIPNIGRYKTSAYAFMLGIFLWFTADILLFFCTYVLSDDTLFSDLSDKLYLAPDYCFAAGLVIYTFHEFSKTQFQRLMANTFMITVCVFVLGQRFFGFKSSDAEHMDADTVSTLLYFFIVLFTLMIMLMIFLITRFKHHTRAAYLSAIALAIYNIFEIRYTYYMSVEKDPESVYIDIIYLLGLVVYALSYSDPSIAARSKENLLAKSKTRPLQMYIVYINSVLIMMSSIVLYAGGFFHVSDLYILLVATMAYIIMEKSMQANLLTEQLLAAKEADNERLERLVAEKTKELSDMNEYLETISNTDALTGLYNRRYGFSLLETLTEDERRQPFALFSMDLNFFKPINDNYGHDKGDHVLRVVGKRLSHISNEDYTAIRVGGDEFMLVLENVEDIKTAESFAEKICKSIDDPIADKEHTYQISTSIGIAVYPQDTDNIEQLLQLADTAMYSIKHKTKTSSYCFHKE